MIEVHKILTEDIAKTLTYTVELHQYNVTRGQNLELVNWRCHYD